MAKKWRKDPQMHKAFKERRELDCQRCQVCGNEINLTVHHLYAGANYPSLRADIWNLVTLCQECHTEYHRIFNNVYNHKMVNADTFIVWLSNNQYVCNCEGRMEENPKVGRLIKEVVWRKPYLRKIASNDER